MRVPTSPPRCLEDRTFSFACDIVRFCRALSGRPGIHRHVAYQLLRSGTSVGANVEEAKAAFTRREFACKYSLVLRECRETVYWLRLIATTGLSDEPTLTALLAEASELVAIFTAATRKARVPRDGGPSPVAASKP